MSLGDIDIWHLRYLPSVGDARCAGSSYVPLQWLRVTCAPWLNPGTCRSRRSRSSTQSSMSRWLAVPFVRNMWTLWSVCLQTSGFVSPIFLLSVVAASLSLCFFMFGHSTCGVFLDCFLCAPCSVNQPTYFLLCTFFRRCIRGLSVYSFTCLLKPTQNNVQNYVSLACVLLWKNTIH